MDENINIDYNQSDIKANDIALVEYQDMFAIEIQPKQNTFVVFANSKEYEPTYSTKEDLLKLKEIIDIALKIESGELTK